MRKSERLQAIVHIQAQQEKQLLQALGFCQQQLQAVEKQLQDLQTYRREYAQKFQVLERHGVSVGQLMEYRAFCDKLDKAIGGQQRALEQKNREYLALLRDWKLKHQKTSCLQKITEQAVGKELKQAEKLEQAEQDERASRVNRNNGMSSA